MMEHFRSFTEDYNTATMPHNKFYHYEQWEIQEYQRKLAQDRQQQQQEDEDNYKDYRFNDEEELRRSKKTTKDREEMNKFQLIHSVMKQNKSLREDMKRQSELQLELTQAHKRGDVEKVKKLEKLLAPDEPSDQPAVKHPWA
jgi:Na+-translocating ferredoxin:NAD+ oxidoreductase RnfC subunit